MRIALLLLLAGCPTQGDSCEVDTQCDSGDVCSREHLCVSPSEVKSVKAQWTINNEPASAAACMGRDLHIEFFGLDQQSDSLGFAPVPCPGGSFFVDKLPVRYDRVGLRFEGTSGGDTALFDQDGIAQLNLSL